MDTESMVEPKVEQIYEVNRRDEKYQILFVDEDVVLLRCDTTGEKPGNSHRVERRKSFDEQVESGYFEYLPDSDLDMIEAEKVDWAEVPYIGKKTAYKLHRNGYETVLDAQKAEDSQLLDVPGLGQSGLENLREFVR